ARWIPAREQGGAPPGNCTLLVGVTAGGLATSLAAQARREESNPRASTVGAWRSPLSYGEMTLSTGIEPASPGRQPGRIARRVRELGTGEPLVPPASPSSGNRTAHVWPARAQRHATAKGKHPERDSNPRRRLERPASP